MRAALIVLMLLAPRAWADDSKPDGFDHNTHARDLFTSGAPEPIACTKCHAVQNGLLVGRPDHGSCFGQCHGPAPAKGVRGTKPAVGEAQQRTCTACHAGSALAKPYEKKLFAVAYPPYLPTDFALAANHKSHAAVACGSCHLAVGTAAKPGAPHKRCISCHDGSGSAGKGPAMTQCQTCHTPGSGTPLPPRLAAPVNTVTSTFSHRTHAARGGKGAQCVTCHAAIPATNDNTLPRTPATSCAVNGCHDGAPVFSITANCTRCHTTAPEKYDTKPRDTRFSHATHKDTGLPCTGCHLVGANEVLTTGHGPCVTCHAEDFTKREPLYCSACHNSTEPWRKLIADRGPAELTEFGAMFDHTLVAHKRECATCHSLSTAASQLRPPRGHKACTGSGCHAATSGPAPKLAACEGCHQRGLAENRNVQRIAAAWSVRATFEHGKHTRGKDGTALPCTSCHTDLTATTISALATPAKATCLGCHDGTTSFKLTGTGCVRCHPAPRTPGAIAK